MCVQTASLVFRSRDPSSDGIMAFVQGPKRRQSESQRGGTNLDFVLKVELSPE